MEEMKSSALERGMSRRSLLKWAGLATVGSAALGATGCVGFNEKTPISDTGDVDENPGEWIPCSCWVDCGSKGFNKALVKNGEVVRLGTDKSHEDSPDCPQLRGCARGRSLRGMIFGADRIKYPMKRKNWQPGGGEAAHGLHELAGVGVEDALGFLCAALAHELAVREVHLQQRAMQAEHACLAF